MTSQARPAWWHRAGLRGWAPVVAVLVALVDHGFVVALLMLAGVVVGMALGFAGAALQSVARNALASPDTLEVNAGAYLAVVAVAALGLALPLFVSAGVAMAGGLLAAGLVTSSRFTRSDCWTRTGPGAEEVARLRA